MVAEPVVDKCCAWVVVSRPVVSVIMLWVAVSVAVVVVVVGTVVVVAVVNDVDGLFVSVVGGGGGGVDECLSTKKKIHKNK